MDQEIYLNEKELLNKHEGLLSKEEAFWKQKSRKYGWLKGIETLKNSLIVPNIEERSIESPA